MKSFDKIRIKIVKKLFTEKFPEFPGILLNIISNIYYYMFVKDIFKYNFFLSLFLLKQEKHNIGKDTEIVYVDHKHDHYELTKLHIGIEKLDIVLFNKFYFVFEKSFPYFIFHHLNPKIKILHIGTIEFLSLTNIHYLINYCKKNDIFLITTYHAFGHFEEDVEILKKFDLVIALSDKFRSSLEENGLNKVIVNYLPSSYFNIISPKKEIAKETLNIKTNKIVFSLIGNIRDDKGYDFFLNVIQSLDKKYKEKLFLNIVGKIIDNTYNEISEILPNCGVEYRLIGTKVYMSDEEFVFNIVVSDALIVPYTRDTSNASGPMIEAACRMIPIIGTDNGDIGYTIDKWNVGIKFKHKNEEDLKNKIIEFIDGKDNFDFTFDKFIDEHSPTKFREKHQKIYQEILNNTFLIENYR